MTTASFRAVPRIADPALPKDLCALGTPRPWAPWLGAPGGPFGSSWGALYLHVPFCVRRCRYCDFSTQATRRGDALVGAYMDALAGLVQRLGDASLLAGARTAYVGGGTPTFAGAQLAALGRAVRQACGASLGEFSSEANPESLDVRLVGELAAAGYTRISLGVQSLDDEELARLGRAHTARRALDACTDVVAQGLALSCDLMCGIPCQTPASWQRSLEGVLATGAVHVSCYPLMIEDGTPLAAAIEQGEESEPDDDLQATLMLAAERTMHQAGFERYEVASYARPEHACRHNIAYWTGVSYLGLGSYASSMMDPTGLRVLADAVPLCLATDASNEYTDVETYLACHPETGRVRLRCVQDARAFAGACHNGLPLRFEAEALTAREAAAEDLMLGLRMTSGVSAALLERAAWAGVPSSRLTTNVQDVVARGLARRTDAGGLAPTEQGWLLGNELYGAFWDLAHDD